MFLLRVEVVRNQSNGCPKTKPNNNFCYQNIRLSFVVVDGAREAHTAGLVRGVHYEKLEPADLLLDRLHERLQRFFSPQLLRRAWNVVPQFGKPRPALPHGSEF